MESYNPVVRPAPLLLLLCAAGPARAEDLAAQIGDRDVAQRLAAVATLQEKGDPRAEELLLKALKDRDWEVIHRAAEALGTRGSPQSVDELVDLAVSGPVRRIRLAAAASAARLDAAAAAERLSRKLRGDDLIPAAEALAVVAHPWASKDLERIVKRKDKKAGPARVAALRALGALGEPGRIQDFAELLTDEDVDVAAAAVEALVRTKDSAAIVPLRDGLNAERMTAVLERRHLAAIRELLVAQGDADKCKFAAEMVVRSFGMGGAPATDARFARLLGMLGSKDAPVGPVDEYVRALTSVGLKHREAFVRAATVAALGRIGRPETYDRVATLAQGDPSPRVRFHALRAAVAIRGDEALPLLKDRLASDADKGVREEAAVICGKRRLADSMNALVAALSDREWEVAVAAAISAGSLRDARALSGLAAMASDKDWRRRGGALVGLGSCKQKEAIPLLIDALRDKEPAVARTALEFLRRIAGEGLADNQKTWREWWDTWEKTFVFRDRAEEAKQAKKYGYAVQERKVYEDLDVIVLQTRKGGDNIQFLLEDYGIEHRIVRAASIAKCGLHPYALFVANCPGEIVDKDVERLQWYVRAGGYLFASCWALTHTVQVCFPDVVQKLQTRAQVVDTVEAEPVPVESPFTQGVFDGVTQPLYELVGSHLIDVIDPERFEVLVDSPETATRWGDGNLAGWFTVGHGLVLDSANHFDMQGMRQAKVRDEKERMAFAIDHLGYDYAEARRLKEEGVFAKQPEAIQKTRDLSMFRLITTFVRQKRIADEE